MTVPPAISAPAAILAEGPPLLDDEYIRDIRQWVGDASLAELLACAPSVIRAEFEQIRHGQQSGDFNHAREAAHRLAGAAGSVGARRLADLARRCQTLTDSDVTPAAIDDLNHTLIATLQALEDEVKKTAAA